MAWGLTLVVGSAWVIMGLLGQTLPTAVPVLAVFLLGAALSMSLGNWMDRQTILRLEEEGVFFVNGLRRVQLQWDQIRQVQVFPSTWGKNVRVIGPGTQFTFRTLGEVKVQDEVKGRMGFADGERILRRILEKAKLKKVDQNGSGYYYARE